MSVLIIVGVVFLAIVWLLYSSNKEQKKRELDFQEVQNRIAINRKIYEDSVRRTRERAERRPLNISSPQETIPSPDNTTTNIAALLLMNEVLDSSPSHDSPSHDSSSSDCGSSSYDSDSSSSSDCGGSSGGSDF